MDERRRGYRAVKKRIAVGFEIPKNELSHAKIVLNSYARYLQRIRPAAHPHSLTGAVAFIDIEESHRIIGTITCFVILKLGLKLIKE